MFTHKLVSIVVNSVLLNILHSFLLGLSQAAYLIIGGVLKLSCSKHTELRFISYGYYGCLETNLGHGSTCSIGQYKSSRLNLSVQQEIEKKLNVVQYM